MGYACRLFQPTSVGGTLPWQFSEGGLWRAKLFISNPAPFATFNTAQTRSKPLSLGCLLYPGFERLPPGHEATDITAPMDSRRNIPSLHQPGPGDPQSGDSENISGVCAALTVLSDGRASHMDASENCGHVTWNNQLEEVPFFLFGGLEVCLIALRRVASSRLYS